MWCGSPVEVGSPKKYSFGVQGEVKITWAREQPNDQVKNTLLSSSTTSKNSEMTPLLMHIKLGQILAIHWLDFFLDLTDFAEQDKKFIHANEINVHPKIFKEWRASAIKDLSLFLKLRAEELCDHGLGLFLMVGGGNGSSKPTTTETAQWGKIPYS